MSLPTAWQEESSLELRVGEVKQASAERLNSCINIVGSPRTHAYVAEGGEGGSTIKLAPHAFHALPLFPLISCFFQIRCSIKWDISQVILRNNIKCWPFFIFSYAA